MKIDELISELEQVKEEHGNLEVDLHIPTYGLGYVTGVKLQGGSAFLEKEMY